METWCEYTKRDAVLCRALGARDTLRAIRNDPATPKATAEKLAECTGPLVVAIKALIDWRNEVDPDRLAEFELDPDVDDTCPGLSTDVQSDDWLSEEAESFAEAVALAFEDPKRGRALVEQVLNLSPDSDQVPPELRDALRGVQHLSRCLARGQTNVVLPEEEQQTALLELWKRASANELAFDFVGDSLLCERVREVRVEKSADGRNYTDAALVGTLRLLGDEGAEQSAALYSGKLHGNGKWQSAFGECTAPSCEGLFVRMGPQTQITCCKACVARAGRARQGATTRPRPPKPRATDSPFWRR